jgi:acyl carrier protein
MLAETAVDCVRTCCEGAAAAAGVTLEQINFFVFNTPTAWYVSVCTRALGIDPERTINLYPRYANIGPVFPIANLYHAAQAGKIRENDLVLVYTNGAAATAAAMVMRWGDVALGSVPASPMSVTPEQERIHLAIKAEKVLTGATSFLSREQILAAKPGERRQMLEEYLLECLAGSLQLPTNELNSQQSLATLLDSLMAIVLRSRIETDLQVRVPMEKFFGETTVTQLAEYLLNQLTLANLISLDSVANANEGEEREVLSF